MEEIKILPELYDFIVWYSAKISGYPRKYKYTLGNRITDIQLNILEQIIEAKYGSKKKAHFLRRTNVELEKLRFMIRLSKDLQCINLKTFEKRFQTDQHHRKNGRRLGETTQGKGKWDGNINIFMSNYIVLKIYDWPAVRHKGSPSNRQRRSFTSLRSVQDDMWSAGILHSTCKVLNRGASYAF